MDNQSPAGHHNTVSRNHQEIVRNSQILSRVSTRPPHEDLQASGTPPDDNDPRSPEEVALRALLRTSQRLDQRDLDRIPVRDISSR